VPPETRLSQACLGLSPVQESPALAAASCPICFEDFQEAANPTPSAPPLPLDGDGSAKRDDSSHADDSSAPLLNPLSKAADMDSKYPPPSQKSPSYHEIPSCLPCKQQCMNLRYRSLGAGVVIVGK